MSVGSVSHRAHPVSFPQNLPPRSPYGCLVPGSVARVLRLGEQQCNGFALAAAEGELTTPLMTGDSARYFGFVTQLVRALLVYPS